MIDGEIKRRRLFRIGGAKNWADRKSWQLTEHDCRKLLNATDVADAAGMPFNRFVTISWELCGVHPKESVAATGDWIKLAREWVTSQGCRMPWVWVQECGPKLGAHCHILIHVPSLLSPLFRGKPEKWTRKIVYGRGGEYRAGALRTLKVGKKVGEGFPTEAQQADVTGNLHYMLKSAPADLEAKLGLVGWPHAQWGQACLVYGKRAGAWQFASILERRESQ